MEILGIPLVLLYLYFGSLTFLKITNYFMGFDRSRVEPEGLISFFWNYFCFCFIWMFSILIAGLIGFSPVGVIIGIILRLNGVSYARIH